MTGTLWHDSLNLKDWMRANEQILEANPNMTVPFGSWLSQQGLDEISQYAYTKSGWLHRLSKGVYKVRGTTPALFQTTAAYNSQLVESSNPDWACYELEYFRDYPSVKWKLLNLKKLARQNPQKPEEQVKKLQDIFHL